MDTEITKPINDIFTGVDERDWLKITNALADEVVIDYTSLNGGEPKLQTADEVAAAWASFLPGFDATHHEVSDFKRTVKGEDAVVHYKGKAAHFLNKEVWKVEGTFETELRKTNDGWRITKHKFIVTKQEGNSQLSAKATEVLKLKRSRAQKQSITFASEGLVLAGDLYKPEDYDKTKKYPAIVVGGSWTTVKEQMSGLYAAKLAEQGFITLAIDPRFFGGSEGQPRFWENPKAKTEDYKNSLSFLETVEGVDIDNIFLVAVCASAGYLSNVCAEDKRVRGFATVAAWLHDAESVKPIYGGQEGVKTKISQARDAKRKFAQSGSVEYIPTVSRTDKNAAMFGEFDYYLVKDRGGIPEWSADKFAVMSWEDWLTYDPMPTATRLFQPTLMIHSEDAALPQNAKKFFNDIPHRDKALRWTKGTQFDFYDQPRQVSESVGAITRFFTQHLK
ncbi:MAG: nuclear transport factor 2 family protein [Chryseolinea sp.]